LGQNFKITFCRGKNSILEGGGTQGEGGEKTSGGKDKVRGEGKMVCCTTGESTICETSKSKRKRGELREKERILVNPAPALATFPVKETYRKGNDSGRESKN